MLGCGTAPPQSRPDMVMRVGAGWQPHAPHKIAFGTPAPAGCKAQVCRLHVVAVQHHVTIRTSALMSCRRHANPYSQQGHKQWCFSSWISASPKPHTAACASPAAATQAPGFPADSILGNTSGLLHADGACMQNLQASPPSSAFETVHRCGVVFAILHPLSSHSAPHSQCMSVSCCEVCVCVLAALLLFIWVATAVLSFGIGLAACCLYLLLDATALSKHLPSVGDMQGECRACLQYPDTAGRVFNKNWSPAKNECLCKLQAQHPFKFSTAPPCKVQHSTRSSSA